MQSLKQYFSCISQNQKPKSNLAPASPRNLSRPTTPTLEAARTNESSGSLNASDISLGSIARNHSPFTDDGASAPRQRRHLAHLSSFATESTVASTSRSTVSRTRPEQQLPQKKPLNDKLGYLSFVNRISLYSEFAPSLPNEVPDLLGHSKNGGKVAHKRKLFRLPPSHFANSSTGSGASNSTLEQSLRMTKCILCKNRLTKLNGPEAEAYALSLHNAE
mmetsp:Transcript_26359/g.40230  ORF Transcript_26359/g.40230 Transcript_26359/m.40230 type:complete len:219 (+) Transcript_26359:33-689(+)